MPGNPSYDALLSTTLAGVMPQLEDNIFTARPLGAWLKRTDHIKSQSGGAKIQVPLIYGLNSTAGSYAGYDSIPTTPQEGITSALYDWKEFATSIAISGAEEAKNRGDAEVIDLLAAKVTQAEETTTEVLDYTWLRSDGTGNSSKDMLGLLGLIATTGDIGGIPAADTTLDAAGASITYWQSFVDSVAEPLTLAKMAKGYNSPSVGNHKPDLVITTQILYEKYESLLQPNERFTNSKLADAGFDNLMFKGTTIFWDDYTTSGVMYFVNSKHLFLIRHSDVWFTHTPFVKPHGQNARYSQILLMGELVVNNRQRQGKLTAKTA